MNGRSVGGRQFRSVTKAERHRQIVELVRNRVIRTQEELVEALRTMDLDVTQATVSRDLHELGVLRIHDQDGTRYVATVADADPVTAAARLRTAVREHVRTLEFIGNIGVIRTRPSSAPLVASAIDHGNFDEVAGTLAGDDTVIVVARSPRAARSLSAQLDEMSR